MSKMGFPRVATAAASLLLLTTACNLFFPPSPTGQPIPLDPRSIQLVLINQSGVPVRADAVFLAAGAEVRRTSRFLEIAGVDSSVEALPTPTDTLTIEARETTPRSSGKVNDLLLRRVLTVGVDFVGGDTITIIIPAAVVPPPAGQNLPPVAVAGANQTVLSGATFQLNGGNSHDPENAALTFLWTQASGPNVALNNSASATPTATAPIVAAGGTVTLVYTLLVSDPSGQTGTSQVTITVVGPGVVIASALAAPNPLATGGTATLTASVTGGIAPYTFQWSVTPPAGHGAGQFVSATANPAQWISPAGETGTWSFGVSVRDAQGNTGTASATLAVTSDCNTNGTVDSNELAGHDCNTNNVPDVCDLSGGLDGDCNTNGTLDRCDAAGGEVDCNTNGLPDRCELDAPVEKRGAVPTGDSPVLYLDCNKNGTLDVCDIAAGLDDCNTNARPDVCEPFDDCNTNGTFDACDIRGGLSDCNADAIPDECQIGALVLATDTPNLIIEDVATQETSVVLYQPGLVADVNVGIDIAHTYDGDLIVFLISNNVTVTLTDGNGGGDENFTGTVFDDQALVAITDTCGNPPLVGGGANCDAAAPFTGTFRPQTPLFALYGAPVTGTWTLRVTDDAGGDTGTLTTWTLEVRSSGQDCDTDGVVDSCELTGRDCNTNGTPDVCELPGRDCNTNGSLDACDVLAAGTDCNTDGLPDACGVDCDTNGVADECDLAGGAADCNTNGISDRCDLIAPRLFLSQLPDHFEGTPSDTQCPFCGGGPPAPAGLPVGSASAAVHFMLDQPTSLGQIKLWGFYPPTNMPSPVDDFTVIVHADAKGGVGPALVTLPHVASTRAAVGAVFGFTEFEITLTPANPIPLAAGGYFIEIFNNSTGSPNTFIWETGTLDASHGISGFAQAFQTPGQSWSITQGATLALQLFSPSLGDCNTNGVPDECDLAVELDGDCNTNRVPDLCELPAEDCNTNGQVDACDVYFEDSVDCDTNNAPDECQADCNTNGTADTCDAVAASAYDCDTNGTPDECEPDCNTNGYPDACDAAYGSAHDCNTNQSLDECEVADEAVADCNANGVPDACDLALGGTFDCNTDGTIDACGADADCDSNGTPDACDLSPFGQAVEFSGGQFVHATFINVSETDYTASLWFKTSDGDAGLFSVDSGFLGGNGVDRNIFLAGGDLAARIWDDETIRTSGQNFADGQWHQVVHVFGGGVGGQRLYVDGVLRASGMKSQSDFYWQSGVNIGFSNDAVHQFLTGRIDEVRIWRRALSTSEILANYQTLAPPAMVDLQAWYRFDELAGSQRVLDFGTSYTAINVTLGSDTLVESYDPVRVASDVSAPRHVDCNANGTLDACEGLADCNTDGSADICQLAALGDCNTNLVPDLCELAAGDCNTNGSLDVCDLFFTDCNSNGTHDVCEAGFADCNTNFVPDVCETDCNTNGRPDDCDIAHGSADCNMDGVLNVCEADCDSNGTPDACDINAGAPDCDTNGKPDACDLASGATDCNTNAKPDRCEPDCNSNGTADDCDPFADCNTNGTFDPCDIVFGDTPDCNTNAAPDVCDVAYGFSLDCNTDAIPNECQLTANDCNTNAVPDDCDIDSSGDSKDCNTDRIPDECELAMQDCNTNGVPDVCDLGFGPPLIQSASPLAPISDFQFTSSPMAVTAMGRVVDVNVDVEIAHSLTSDLQIYLYWPTGSLPLASGRGTGANFLGTIFDDQAAAPISAGDSPFTGNFRPETALAFINGSPAAGNWALGVTDSASGNNGTLLSWTLILQTDLTGDCDTNGVPDACELVVDCNTNGRLDACDIGGDSSQDTNQNGVPDVCE